MIIVHHLNNSRSQRIVWLLEELKLDYSIKAYQRDDQTMLAPPELAQVHPLGKSPVIEDGELIIAETGPSLSIWWKVMAAAPLFPRRGQRTGCSIDTGCILPRALPCRRC